MILTDEQLRKWQECVRQDWDARVFGREQFIALTDELLALRARVAQLEAAAEDMRAKCEAIARAYAKPGVGETATETGAGQRTADRIANDIAVLKDSPR